MPIYTIKHKNGLIILTSFELNGWILELGDEEPGLVFAKTYLSAIRTAGFDPSGIISVSF